MSLLYIPAVERCCSMTPHRLLQPQGASHGAAAGAAGGRHLLPAAAAPQEAGVSNSYSRGPSMLQTCATHDAAEGRSRSRAACSPSCIQRGGRNLELTLLFAFQLELACRRQLDGCAWARQ